MKEASAELQQQSYNQHISSSSMTSWHWLNSSWMQSSPWVASTKQPTPFHVPPCLLLHLGLVWMSSLWASTMRSWLTVLFWVHLHVQDYILQTQAWACVNGWWPAVTSVWCLSRSLPYCGPSAFLAPLVSFWAISLSVCITQRLGGSRFVWHELQRNGIPGPRPVWPARVANFFASSVHHRSRSLCQLSCSAMSTTTWWCSCLFPRVHLSSHLQGPNDPLARGLPTLFYYSRCSCCCMPFLSQ